MIAILLTLFAGRMVQLQGLDSAHYKQLATTEQLKTITLPAQRGHHLRRQRAAAGR